MVLQARVGGSQVVLSFKSGWVTGARGGHEVQRSCPTPSQARASPKPSLETSEKWGSWQLPWFFVGTLVSFCTFSAYGTWSDSELDCKLTSPVLSVFLRNHKELTYIFVPRPENGTAL